MKMWAGGGPAYGLVPKRLNPGHVEAGGAACHLPGLRWVRKASWYTQSVERAKKMSTPRESANEVMQFGVDTHLAVLLSENYRSVEHALKELVDNAWDADAVHVAIHLPDVMSNAPIVVEDDGVGMKPNEVTGFYLKIANPRWSRRGERTPGFGRVVKGRKGIGKFAGLVAADVMRLDTRASGQKTTLEISRRTLQEANTDLERVDLPVERVACGPGEHGTKITLSGLRDRFELPKPERMRELLALEYARQEHFQITVNGEPLTLEDVQGAQFSESASTPEAGPVKLDFTIMEKSRGRKHAGISIRVNGKIVGPPGFFGLDEDEEIPPKVLERLVGVIDADGLVDDVTADWGSIVENSKAVDQVNKFVRSTVGDKIKEEFARDVALRRANLNRRIDAQLAKLPENRRRFAEREIDGVLRRFYDQPADRVEAVVHVMLNAMEYDDYWRVVESIHSATAAGVEQLAAALDAFGLLTLAHISRRSSARLKMLEGLDALIQNDATKEMEVHKALENNLWVLGPQYSLYFSNQTLQTILSKQTEKWGGVRKKKRPDLFLGINHVPETDGSRRYLLIEFKRPKLTIGRKDENQAEEYRDDLVSRFPNISVLVLGGKVDDKVQAVGPARNCELRSYGDLVSSARAQYEWIVRELSQPS